MNTCTNCTHLRVIYNTLIKLTLNNRNKNIISAYFSLSALLSGEFNIHGSVSRNNILIYIQQDATFHSLFYLETALHVWGGTITYQQERKQLFLQHLVFVTPLLPPAAIVEELELVWVCFTVYQNMLYMSLAIKKYLSPN